MQSALTHTNANEHSGARSRAIDVDKKYRTQIGLLIMHFTLGVDAAFPFPCP